MRIFAGSREIRKYFFLIMKKMKKLLTRLVLSDILIPTFLVGKKTERKIRYGRL